MWIINNNKVERTWFHTFLYQYETRFGPACEFFNDNTRFCAGQLEDNIIVFSLRYGIEMQRCSYDNGTPFTFFILFPASSQFFVGDTNDSVIVFDISKKKHRKIPINRCTEHKLYPLELLPTNSDLVGYNVNMAKMAFLVIDQMVGAVNPLTFSERWTNEWIIRTLSPSGHYCVLHQQTKQKIQVVSVDELIQSFTFIEKNDDE